MLTATATVLVAVATGTADAREGPAAAAAVTCNFTPATIVGTNGDDTFVAEATPDGSDDFVGDGGQDTVKYLSRTVGVNVSLDGEPNDGQPDERDKVRLSVENVSGCALGSLGRRRDGSVTCSSYARRNSAAVHLEWSPARVRRSPRRLPITEVSLGGGYHHCREDTD